MYVLLFDAGILECNEGILCVVCMCVCMCVHVHVCSVLVNAHNCASSGKESAILVDLFKHIRLDVSYAEETVAQGSDGVEEVR
jgi:hypothetical protein